MANESTKTTGIRAAVGLVVVSCLIAGLGIEGAARLYVGLHWPAARVELYTTQSKTRGRYTYHPKYAYYLTPDFHFDDGRRFDHDHRGFRSAEIADVKPPGVLRIAAIGGSTTYGVDVSNHEAYPQVLGELLTRAGFQVEVINAGTPGWTSMQSVASLEDRILPLAPDLVVAYQGRNELMPQAYDHFAEDYSHYWQIRDFRETNALYKRLNRISNAFMVVAHAGGHDGLGWDATAESPMYGAIRYENHPTPEATVKNLEDPARTVPYRRNVERLVRASRAAGAEVVLATMAFRPEGYKSASLYPDPLILPALAAQVEENNQVVREVGAATGVMVSETAVLAEEPALFPKDDCHMGAEGLRRRAEIVFETLKASGALERLRAKVAAR